MVILVAKLDMLRDGLGNTVEDALQVVELARLLDLHEDNLTLGVLGLDVNAVELVVDIILIAFTLQNLVNLHLLFKEHGHETLQHCEICFVAQHTLGSPIESDVLVHINTLYIPAAKIWKKNEAAKLFLSFS